MSPTLAVYPGSFDPLTNGHVDIILRGARLFDRIIVAILVNGEKAPLFSMEERVEITRSVFRDQPNVEVDTFDGLLVDYVERRKAQVIVRGLRAVSDFEFEFQMALMNQRLNGAIQTVFMMPAEQYTYISSRLIKEVFSLGGRVHGLVPELVEARLRDKLAMNR
jgi:pantetheine-phosphate adenylyltransferase